MSHPSQLVQIQMKSKPTEATGTVKPHPRETELKPKLPLQPVGSRLHFVSLPPGTCCVSCSLCHLWSGTCKREENGECKRLFFSCLGSGGKGHVPHLAEILLLQRSGSLTGGFYSIQTNHQEVLQTGHEDTFQRSKENAEMSSSAAARAPSLLT